MKKKTWWLIWTKPNWLFQLSQLSYLSAGHFRRIFVWDQAVAVYMRRFCTFRAVTQWLIKWSLFCHLGIWSSFNVNCLFLGDLSCWPFSLASHQHKQVLMWLSARQIGRWHHISKFFSFFHSEDEFLTSPKSTIFKL